MSVTEKSVLEFNSSECHGVLQGDKIISCTNGFAGVLLQDGNDFKDRSLLDFSPKYQADGETSTEQLKLRLEAAKNGLPQSFEWRFLQIDGTVINALLNVKRQRISQNSQHFVFKARILDDSKTKKETMRDSKLLLQQMLDNSTAVVYVKDYRGRFQFVNREFVDTFKVNEQQIIGKSVFDVFQEDVAQKLLDNDRRIFRSKQPTEFEEVVQINGEPHTYSSIKFPLFNSDNEVYAVCGISTDITAKKKTDDAFRGVALGVSGSSYDNIFESIVSHLAETLDVELAFVGRYQADNTVKTLALYSQKKIVPNITYHLKNTPCEGVVGKDYLFVPKDIRQLYPSDAMLFDLRLEAYAGFPLYDSKGNQQGLISIGSVKPLTETNIIRSVLEIFSVRASAELERLEADEAKRISEESYRSIFEASEDAIFVHDLHSGAIVDVNPKACKNFGYTKDEFLNLGVQDLGPGSAPFDMDLAQMSMEKARNGEPQHVEWRRKNKDGSLCWDEVFIKRATIAGVDRILAIARDITEKKLAEDKLRTSEELYRIIFNSSVDGLVVFDEYGQIIDTNTMFKVIHGYAADADFSNIQPSDVIPEDHIPVYEEYIRTVVAEGRDHIIGQGLKKDGSRTILDIHGVRMLHFGKVQLLTIVRDITEQKRAEEALRKSEDRLRATFEAALDAIIGINEKGLVIEFNPAAESCFGYTRDQAIGTKLADLIIPLRFREAHHKGISHYLQTGTGPFIGKRIEVNAMRADGSEFLAELAIDVTQGVEGKIFIGYMRDITEQKNAEQARARLEAQLRQAQKMEAIGHLTGGIAHDFNNILTSVMGNIILAEDLSGKYNDKKLDKYLARATRSGEKARDLIQQMLTFSRGQRGEPRALSLGPLVKESVKLLEASLPSSVEIETSISPEVSQVMIDPVHLEQILVNLCINARDALNGNGCISISVKQHEFIECNCESCKQAFSGHYVELSVKDNGCGIPSEVLDRMFEPFYSTKEVGKGSGMGLSTVHGIVHEYNGHIRVTTTVGQGSNIAILFQSLEQEKDMAEESTLSDSQGNDRPNKLNGRVLLVDDEPDVIEFMQDLLENWGLDVVSCTSSLDALKTFEKNPNDFSLIITDNTMPKMTGAQLAQNINQLNPNLPIIMYTGYRENINDENLFACGVKHIISKPVDVRVMQKHIRDLILN